MFDQEIQLAREALWLVLVLSAPPILAAAIAGLVVAFLQAATQIQEQTFPYAVKFVVVVLALLATTAMLGGTLYNYADRLFRLPGHAALRWSFPSNTSASSSPASR